MNHASTCNSVGVPIGMFFGNVCFTLLVSQQFSSKINLRITSGPGGLITMKSTVKDTNISQSPNTANMDYRLCY